MFILFYFILCVGRKACRFWRFWDIAFPVAGSNISRSEPRTGVGLQTLAFFCAQTGNRKGSAQEENEKRVYSGSTRYTHGQIILGVSVFTKLTRKYKCMELYVCSVNNYCIPYIYIYMFPSHV